MYRSVLSKLAAILIAASVTTFAQAATPIKIDAKANCISAVFNQVSGGASTRFQVAAGRYFVSLTGNSMSCSGGTLTGGCKINQVMLQGGGLDGSARWGVAITNTPSIVEVGNDAYSSFYAYVSDNVCSDNTGSATLLFQLAN